MTAIRAAVTSDAAQIAAIHNKIIRDTTITFTSDEKSTDEIAATITANKTGAFLVAESGDRIVGFASFGQFRPGPGYAQVAEHSIHLCEDARGTGLGRELLATLEEMANKQSIKHLIAGISGENTSGIEFHARHGFAQVGRLNGVGEKFGRSIDLVLMQKTL